MSRDKPLIRGLALLNSTAVVRALYGEPMMARFAARLTEAQRAELEAGFLPGRWYDEDIHARLCLALREQLSDFELARTGVAVLQYHVSRTQRFLARLAGPARVLKRADGLWRWWRDTGRSVVEHVDATSARVAVLGHPLFATPGYAWLFAGASSFVVYLSGARQLELKVDTQNPERVFAEISWAPATARLAGAVSIDACVASLPEKP